ncbi:MAG: hydrogenase formation protein HypD [Proteobacteria bacterium]|nr:hydrogenase formation protein HypD [Pseudomonadota bacterium]
MRYLDEYRRSEQVAPWLAAIGAAITRPLTLMEVCGGQTNTFLRCGLDGLLPEALTLVHGPGCPVCVTPIALIDHALAIAAQPGVIFTSFGDMLRVPGSRDDLRALKARGADVRVVYSPLDALRLAQQHPAREVVFFGVGFETTAPANALALLQAHAAGLRNFSLLSAHVLVPPAIEAILSEGDHRVEGFLAAGHVCAVMGYWQYEPIAARHQVPIVVTGFEPLDLLQGIYRAVTALAAGRAGVWNQYRRAVRREGNRAAQQLLERVFERCDRPWRGLGTLPASGLRLRDAWRDYDAAARFPLTQPAAAESTACLAGEVLRGLRKPPSCPAFGAHCTPDHPLGAPMVSSEGACAAYYRYRSIT